MHCHTSLAIQDSKQFDKSFPIACTLSFTYRKGQGFKLHCRGAEGLDVYNRSCSIDLRGCILEAENIAAVFMNS